MSVVGIEILTVGFDGVAAGEELLPPPPPPLPHAVTKEARIPDSHSPQFKPNTIFIYIFNLYFSV